MDGRIFKLSISNFPIIVGTLSLMTVGKTARLVSVPHLFALSAISAVEAALLSAQANGTQKSLYSSE
ncbi:hypothetical protein KP509_02G038500 [Ceratopteris richardii]|uniref:Uncharacterized protein n=1 Tax=Ceratopteris richardii TaxID=49495 RepID=A0A8T2VGC4_CERRI|nr:hypothetical protein KP509_02G038500 [Ceratopteris richardii]